MNEKLIDREIRYTTARYKLNGQSCNSSYAMLMLRILFNFRFLSKCSFLVTCPGPPSQASAN